MIDSIERLRKYVAAELLYAMTRAGIRMGRES